jgi:hypothetical protein
MIQKKQVTFNSSSHSPEDIAQEFNDLKNILLSIACTLAPRKRKKISDELKSIDSPSIKQWVYNFEKNCKGD